MLYLYYLESIKKPIYQPYGETQAALLACSLAVSLHLEKFVIEGDSSIVIIALQNPLIVMDWHIDHVICNIFSLFSASYILKARKVNKNANFCAHYVA
jgi:hypothetical protein